MRTGPLGTDALRVTDPPHPVYERVFKCRGRCGLVTKVGPFFEHLTAETFVCGRCLSEPIAALEVAATGAPVCACAYCGRDAIGRDDLEAWACGRHLDEVAA